MDNASVILSTLDQHLRRPMRLIIYGRAALQLGFDRPPPEIAESKDVDAIIPLGEIEAMSRNEDFWDAQQATNKALESKGLYITHIFASDQVILRRDWDKHVIKISRPPVDKLSLFRPATLDLILSKMMRGPDPQDIADIRFLVTHDAIPPDQIEAAFGEAVIPDLSEIKEAFESAKPLVRGIASASLK